MPEHVGPAFVDLQVNGFAGVDYNAATVTTAQIAESFAAMEATGVGLCLPTIITSTTDHFIACARKILDTRHPIVAGLHMEGPYISPTDGFRGAHPLACVKDASLDDFRRRQDAAEGRIRLLTLAPEAPGALAVIEAAVDMGVRVALAHTNATTAQIDAAVRAGATLSTHLGNGCPAILPRHPNVIWDQAGCDALHASIVVDGHHLPPATVRVLVRAKGPERCLLVTDAIMAAGAAPGPYHLAGLDVVCSEDGRVAVPGSATLAGSALTMPRAVGLTRAWATPDVGVAWAMASTQPARYLGLEPRGQARVRWSDDWSRVLDVAFSPTTT
ncbi:N-acetylglucosamine-6-phosphate deacetylase [Luteitalea sp.]|uniref:N-acetylglucosamine-6-phosphate deacetylase n=1 Tax=Luteitalea sp. TaxID=2004800 RepID=UPI0037C65433